MQSGLGYRCRRHDEDGMLDMSLKIDFDDVESLGAFSEMADAELDLLGIIVDCDVPLRRSFG